jgi:hypothetical protein
MRSKYNGLLFILGAISIMVLVFAWIVQSTNPKANEITVNIQPLAPQFNGSPPPAPPDSNIDPVADESASAQSEGVIVGWDVKHDVSPALRDLAASLPAPVEATEIREMGIPGEFEEISPSEERPSVEDPVLQSEFTPGMFDLAPAIPAPVANFEGVNNIDGVYPPDTVGEVGPNHFVQMVNLHYQVYTKSGTPVLANPLPNNAIWTGFGAPCETRNDGDPIVLYDQFADRWLLSQFTAANPYGECIAISTSGDPAGSYYRYFFSLSSSVFYDYPKFGIWPDGYYMSANRFGGIFQTFQGASAIVFNRTAMLNGQASSYQQFNTTTSYGSLLPADLEGLTAPPAGIPNFFAEVGSTALHIWKFHVDWANSANSTFTGPTTLTVAAYNRLCSGTRSCIPQPGTSARLDGIGDRLMNRLVYRNFISYDTLVVNHSVNAASSGTRAGVRWYELRNPNSQISIFQQGTYSPDTDNRWMGSITLDSQGNMAMVYSVASASVYPSIRYTGRLVTDAAGTMGQGEATLITGTGSQTGTGSRWGDYSNISVDPVDDCTFWFTTEYIQTTGTAPWRTRIGSFKFPGCGSAPQPSPTPTNTSIPPSLTATFTPAPPTATFTPAPPTFTPTATNTLPPATATNTPSACPNPAAGYCRTDYEARNWIAGTTNQSITGDDTTRTIALPFTFRFMGTNYSNIVISSNGNVHFSTASNQYSNVAIPNTARPNAMIAGLWDDLNPSAGGAIYTAVSGTAPNRIIVIEWRNVPRYGAGTNGATFEIQLVETTNHIWILYQDTDFGSSAYNFGASATSGVENSAGNAGNQYSYNQAVLLNNKNLHFFPQ